MVTLDLTTFLMRARTRTPVTTPASVTTPTTVTPMVVPVTTPTTVTPMVIPQKLKLLLT